jgi:hypothetical protein
VGRSMVVSAIKVVPLGVIAKIRCDGLDPAQAGLNPDRVFVVQASYSKGIINKMSLRNWQAGNTPISFGHPRPPD